MSVSEAAMRLQLAREVTHWTQAVARLGNLQDLASVEAWARLETYLGVAVRRHLSQVVERLERQGAVLRAKLDAAGSAPSLAMVERELAVFRRLYLRAETTLDFYGDAVNTRSNPVLGGLLRACDTLAYRSMRDILEPLGHSAPVVLTYIDSGLGAAILKAGLRLWDGQSESPAAAVKIARHNLLRPTALIHEAGHQVAHALQWNGQLAALLLDGLSANPGLANVWAGWASEISADAFAFVHTGYASVAALHDILDGDDRSVFRLPPGDPHPMGYLRVLLGVEMCRYYYGQGPWDDLASAWVRRHGIERASSSSRRVISESLPELPTIVRLVIDTPLPAFAGRSLADMLNPRRVAPTALEGLEQRLGPALYSSMHWIWTESLRLTALTGLRVATEPRAAAQALRAQENCMLRLGGTEAA
jgi:hypothetical protein